MHWRQEVQPTEQFFVQRWPWITMALTALAVLSPVGRDIIHSSFYSGEQLARSLGQLVIMIYGSIALGLIALEWLVRWWWARRRRLRSGA